MVNKAYSLQQSTWLCDSSSVQRTSLKLFLSKIQRGKLFLLTVLSRHRFMYYEIIISNTTIVITIIVNILSLLLV